MNSSQNHSASLTVPRTSNQLELVVPILLLLGALVVLPLDFAVGQWAVGGGCPGFFRELFEAAEPFGNGNGVLYIVLAVVAIGALLGMRWVDAESGERRDSPVAGSSVADNSVADNSVAGSLVAGNPQPSDSRPLPQEEI